MALLPHRTRHVPHSPLADDDAPAYRLEVPRSYAGSFMDQLTAGATKFGLEVLPAGRS